ncbi:MAG: hypothetical protein WAP52_00795, partial [Candidatus Sungiibacteriota bacterium]
PERTKQLLAESGAMEEGHFVGTSGVHFSLYVAKDRATRLTSVASELCAGIAERFVGYDIDVVVAPAIGAIPLSHWTAHHLTRLRPDYPEVLALYTEYEEVVLGERIVGGDSLTVTLSSGRTFEVAEGEKIILRRPRFMLKRGFAEDVRGRRVLGVEDTLTTGGSARGTARAIIDAGGILIGVAALVNGGGVTAAQIGVSRLEALVSIERQIFTEEECARDGLCAKGVQVNTKYGHGAAFLARKRAQ